MTTFEEALANGTGRLEFVWHVRGMPWAVCTSKEFATHLAGDTTSRRAMFGSEKYDSDSRYFADYVDVYPFLEPPGPQTITNEDAMSALTGGTWTAQIADIPPWSAAWTFSGRTSAAGLEGLQSIANPRVDTSILTGHISAALRKTETALSFDGDFGGRLGTACAAASDAAPIIVWIGGEAMSVTGGTSTGTTGTATIGARGILGSVEQYHGPNKTTFGAPAIRVANSPLGGIANRPYALWAFVFCTEGRSTSVIGPVLVRHGKVSSSVSFGNGEWSIECLPWWSWLDTEIDVTTVTAPLDKYILSRWRWDYLAESYGDSYSAVEKKKVFKGKHPPHAIVMEYVSLTDTWSRYDVWLCLENEAVCYDTVLELEEAICAAMTTESAASGNTWTYEWSPVGPISHDLAEGDLYAVAGEIPILLGWKSITAADGANVTISNSVNADYIEEQRAVMLRDWMKRNTWGKNLYDDYAEFMDGRWAWYDSEAIDEMGESITIGESGFGFALSTKPAYILQWGWEDGTTTGGASVESFTKLFSVPISTLDGLDKARIWINPDYDIQSIATDQRLQLGTYSTSHLIQRWPDPEDPTISFTTAAEFYAASIGAGGATANYIIVSDEINIGGVYPAFRGLDSGDSDYSEKKFQRGQTLFGFSAGPLGEWDYWPISQSFDLKAEKLGTLFKGILGANLAASDNVAEEIQADHIPWNDTIDWNQLDDMVSSGASLPFETTFGLRYNGQINLWKLLNAELKFYGLTPTYKWSPGDGQYVIRFRSINATNASASMLTGATISNSNLAIDTKPTAEHASAWQVNSLSVSLNYNPEEEKFSYHYKVLDESGYSPTGGKVTTLEIEPMITRVKDLETSPVIQAEVIAYLSSYLENTIDPRPAIKADLSLARFLALGVGVDCETTIQDVHNPFQGTAGVAEWPSTITSQTVDYSKSKASTTAVMAARYTYGWAPSLLITKSTESAGDVTVTGIGGNGQLFSGTETTDGWYDHWFFADCTFDATQAVPTLVSSAQYLVTLVERGSKTPTVITGVLVESVDLRDYATVAGDTSIFLTLSNASGYDDAKEWWMTFDAYDQALEDPQRKYVYIADDTLMINDYTTGDEPGRMWE